MYRVIKRNSVVADEKYEIPITQIVPEPPEEEEIDGQAREEGGDSELEESGREKEEDEKAEAAKEREKEIEAEMEEIRKEIISVAKEQVKRTADLVIGHTLENARTELDRAITQGYSDGFESGKNEALGIITPALGKIGILTDEVIKTQDLMLEDFKDEMFEVIGEISQKILHKEIDEKDEYLLTLFEDALKNMKAENFVNVIVSEAQAEFATRNIELFKAKVADIKEFKITADENAEKWTMIVETEKTVADASFSVQMNEIEAILNEMRESLYSRVPEFDQMLEGDVQ